MVLYYLLGITVPGFYDSINIEMTSPLTAFKQFKDEAFLKVITEGVDFSDYIADNGWANTSIFTAIGFFVAMFLSPIAQLVPSAATAAALIYVGVLMTGSISKVNWNDLDTSVPAFMTMAIMPFTYNISYGIAFGIFSYIIIKLFTGKVKEIRTGTYVISALFIAMLLLTH